MVKALSVGLRSRVLTAVAEGARPVRGGRPIRGEPRQREPVARLERETGDIRPGSLAVIVAQHGSEAQTELIRPARPLPHHLQAAVLGAGPIRQVCKQVPEVGTIRRILQADRQLFCALAQSSLKP